MGRRREEAPEGFATVKDAAETLGITEQAVRQRIQRETLSAEEHVTPGGEPRYLIPHEALEAAKLAQPAEEAPADVPVHVTVHHPERPKTVRIETGPEGTRIHLDG